MLVERVEARDQSVAATRLEASCTAIHGELKRITHEAMHTVANHGKEPTKLPTAVAQAPHQSEPTP